MHVDHSWRGAFTSGEANTLHAEAFEHRLIADDEWDWRAQVEAHSLGWVVARHDRRLVGFVNVIWDGAIHAWIQDLMVAASHRRNGIGVTMVEIATEHARGAGCEWLHVDFDSHHRRFYIDACGFAPTEAGLIPLR